MLFTFTHDQGTGMNFSIYQQYRLIRSMYNERSATVSAVLVVVRRTHWKAMSSSSYRHRRHHPAQESLLVVFLLVILSSPRNSSPSDQTESKQDWRWIEWNMIG